MGLFSQSKSSTSSTTNLTSTDQRVAATDGSMAFGAGSTVNFQDLSADVAKASITSNAAISKTSIDAQNKSLEAALFFAGNEATASRGLVADAMKTAAPASAASLALAQGLSGLVADKLNPGGPDPGTVKVVAIAGGALLLLSLLFLRTRKS